MTDMAAVALPRARSAELSKAEALVRSRYRAEARFKAYGLAAVLFAAVVLVILLTDIVRNGWPAFFHHRLDLEVTLTNDALDVPPGSNFAKLQTGNFAAPLQAALQAKFPDVSDRTSRRALNGVLSPGAALELRDKVLSDPKIVAAFAEQTPASVTLKIPAMISSNADLYMKGRGGRIEDRAGLGTATPLGTTGEVRVVSSVNDFSDDLAKVRRKLSERARDAQIESDRVLRDIPVYQSRVSALETALAGARSAANAARVTSLEAEITKAKSDVEALSKQSVTLKADAEQLMRRAVASGGSETLDSSTPSMHALINTGVVRVTRISANEIEGKTLIGLNAEAKAAPGAWHIKFIEAPESTRRTNDQEIVWLDRLNDQKIVHNTFHWPFLTSGASREPELAGILGALVGSALTMMVTLLICLPLGVAAAIYLEEFSPKNRLTDIIEVNINNLAAVPSVVFGLLGLSMFLNAFNMPRSSAVVGGLVLALLVLPTIIIASRAALKAVPPSIREAALGIGASHQQAVFHHVLPLAMPGIMTGTIIGMAHALGETAPLLMIGMVAFIVDVPGGVTDAATVLPVQIYQWSTFPEPAFQAKTAGGIMVLLAFLFLMNGAAILLRRRFERRW